MILLAAEESAFALQGPRPEITPGWLEAYWPLALVAAIALGAATFGIRRILRQENPGADPRQLLEQAITQAEQTGSRESLLSLMAALRNYLAAVDERVGPALSTEELDGQLREIPVLVPARQTLLGVLRTTDQAKFSGVPSPLHGALLIAGVRDALTRIEEARPLFRKEPT